MITYSITLKGKNDAVTKVVTVDSDTALQAMSKAKAEYPSYTDVVECKIVKVNF